MPATPITQPASGESLIGTEPQLLQQVDPGWRYRLNLFTGRTLTDTALDGEQTYRAGLLATLGQSVTAGTVSGLDASLDMSVTDPLIVVNPGYGISASGEDVVLNRTLKTALSGVAVIDPVTGEEQLNLTQYHQGASPSFAGVLLLQPVIAQVSGQQIDTGTGPIEVSGNLGASCAMDPTEYAFEDWQIADAVRLVYVPWPVGSPALPLPAATPAGTLRNRLAYAIFEAEKVLGPDDQLPWAMLGVPVALVAFDATAGYKPLFLDCSAVVRAGGLPRRHDVLPTAPPPLTQWTPLTVFAAGSFLVDSNGNIQLVKTAGTSGSPPPSWNQTYGQTTTDGSVVWTNNGPARWQANHSFTAGQFVYDTTNNLQYVVTPGTSGTTAPPWNGMYLPTADGTVTWINNGSGTAPIVQPALADARIRQLSEQLSQMLAQGTTFNALTDIATTLPPSGLLPSAAVDFVNKKASWLPANWSVSAAPILLEELEAALSTGMSLAALTASSSIQNFQEPVELLVPLPDTLYDPDILITETVAPVFQQEVDSAISARNITLQQLKTVQLEVNALTDATGPSYPYNANLIAVDNGLTAVEITGRNAPPPYAPTSSEAFGTALQSTWVAGATHFPGDFIIDANGNLQVAIAQGVNAATAPTWNTTIAGTTTDSNQTWLNNGPWSWQPNTAYVVGQFVVDAKGFRHNVTVAGTSASTPPAWLDSTNPTGAPTVTLDGVLWQASGKPLWQPDTSYAVGQLVLDVTGNIQVVQTAGISGDSVPRWNPNQGQTTSDSAVVWQNLGHTLWTADTLFNAGQAVLDASGNIQLVEVGGVTGQAAPGWNDTLGAKTTDASISWTTGAPITWQPGTNYVVNQIVLDTNGNLQAAQAAGTSGKVAPVWSRTPAGTTQDSKITWVHLRYVPAEIVQLKSIVSKAPYTITYTDSSSGTATQTTINLLTAADMTYLDTHGLQPFITQLNARINQANDLLDTAFLTAQTDIYRFRQNVLGATAATTLATSPVLANIATGVTASATAANLETYLQSLPTGTATTAAPGATSATPVLNFGKFQGVSVLKSGILDTALHSAMAETTTTSVPAATTKVTPRIMMRSQAVTQVAGGMIGDISLVPVREAPITLAPTSGINKTVVDGLNLTAIRPVASPVLKLNSGVLANLGQLVSPGVNVTATTSDITQQSPIAGAQLNIRTLTVAERLQQSPSQEALFYSISNRLSALNALAQIEADLGLVADDIQILVDGTAPPASGSTAPVAVPVEVHTFSEWRVASAQTALLSKVQTPYLNTDVSEASLFSVGVRVVEQHTMLLRALEARVAQYADFVSLCNSALNSMRSSISSAKTYITQLSNNLTQQRQNVAFTSALLADEQNRVASVNARRQSVLASSVQLVAYTRARTLNAIDTAPSRQLVPANVVSPVPACLNQTVSIPPELREVVGQLREAPTVWLPAVSALVAKLDRPTLLLQLATAVQTRAAQQLQLPILPSSSAGEPGVYAAVISTIYTANQKTLRSYVVQRAAIQPSTIANLSWTSQVANLQNVAALNDLIAAESVHTEVSNAVAKIVQQVSSVATCIYTRVSAALPIDRLAWAEYLRGPGQSVSLASLANLPNWNSLSYTDRQQMQLLADWLFQQIDTGYTAASSFMSDVIRTAILLASDVPIDNIIPTPILRRTLPVIGNVITLSNHSDRVASGMIANLYSAGKLTARGVVSDLDSSTVTATITDVFTPNTYLETTDIAHVTAQTPQAVALRAFMNVN